jgi:hypothetical protein
VNIKFARYQPIIPKYTVNFCDAMENFGIVASPIYMIMMDFGKDHINKGGLHKCPYKPIKYSTEIQFFK